MQAANAPETAPENVHQFSKKSELIRIINKLELPHELKSIAEERMRNALAELGIPLANADGQFVLINSEADVDLEDIRVLPQDIEKVEEALSNVLEARNLKAARDIRKQVIEIVRAPSEDAQLALGGGLA